MNADLTKAMFINVDLGVVDSTNSVLKNVTFKNIIFEKGSVSGVIKEYTDGATNIVTSFPLSGKELVLIFSKSLYGSRGLDFENIKKKRPCLFNAQGCQLKEDPDYLHYNFHKRLMNQDF